MSYCLGMNINLESCVKKPFIGLILILRQSSLDRCFTVRQYDGLTNFVGFLKKLLFR